MIRWHWLIYPFLGRGESAPRHLRIYANHAQIVDFDAAEETRPQLNITLQEGAVNVTEYPLRSAAFANIHSLSLFFVSCILSHDCSLLSCGQSEAVGGDMSRVYYIGFKGDTRTIRKDGSTKLVIPAANAADAPLVDMVKEKTGGQQTTAR